MIFMKSKVWSKMSPLLILNGTPVSRAHQHKHLGLWLTPSLDWSKQVEQTCLRANRKLAVLRSCKFLDKSTLDMLYKITIRSVIEYGLVVYFHCLRFNTVQPSLSRVLYIFQVKKNQREDSFLGDNFGQSRLSVSLYFPQNWSA